MKNKRNELVTEYPSIISKKHTPHTLYTHTHTPSPPIKHTHTPNQPTNQTENTTEPLWTTTAATFAIRCQRPQSTDTDTDTRYRLPIPMCAATTKSKRSNESKNDKRSPQPQNVLTKNPMMITEMCGPRVVCVFCDRWCDDCECEYPITDTDNR